MARVHWLDVLIAPLTWLAHARGRRRLALLAAYGLILGVVGVLGGREARLWPLPDAPEPFDLARYGHVDLADADNAMVLYRRADKLRVNLPELFRDLPRGADYAWSWGQADPRIMPWIEANRPALAVWREGTTRPDARLVQPADFAALPTAEYGVFDGLQRLAQFASLEATRRQGAGDLVEAWADHRAVIRSGLHCGRHGGLTAAYIGVQIIQKANQGLLAWADAPGMTPALLRGAIADLAACRALETADSEQIRVYYFLMRDQLGRRDAWDPRQIDPKQPDFWPYHYPIVLRAKYFWDNEPKRSRKVLRLLTLGHLAQCDRPAAARPAVVATNYLIYALDPSTPPPLDRIRPEQLAAWADASACRGAFDYLGFMLGANAGRRAQLDAFRLRLVERAYALDHAGQPAPTYGALVPTYLDALAPGVAPGDPLVIP